MLRVPLFLYTGLKHFTKGGYEQAAKHFDNSIMVQDASLRGKTCMVTGANQGLGFQISLELAKRGGSLYMVCRNEERGRASVNKVKELTQNEDVHLVLCDISSLQDIKKMCGEYVGSGRPLHVLVRCDINETMLTYVVCISFLVCQSYVQVNNAGVLIHDGSTSVDGYEINFATNTLGTYALTKGLEPVLKASAPSRVIMVSSGGALTSGLEVDDLESRALKTKDGSDLYARDKRRQIALAEYFAQHWSEDGVSCYSMHPGWVETEGVKSSIPGFYEKLKDKLRNVEQGADTAVWLSVSPEKDLESGEFYLDRHKASKHLFWGGTRYSTDKVDTLVKNLDAYME